MKFGVREICDVVLKRKAGGWFGKLYLDKDMPVLYFDTLKTSSLEGQATTVYAQGGKGNPRLVAWEGDRVVTFTMEDALISPESFSILSGAGFMDADENNKIYVHTTQQVEVKNGKITLSKKHMNEVLLMVFSKDNIDTTIKIAKSSKSRKETIERLTEEMMTYARKYEFEKAAVIRDFIEDLKNSN